MSTSPLHTGSCNGPLDCKICWLVVFDPRYRAHYGHTEKTVDDWLKENPEFCQRHQYFPEATIRRTPHHRGPCPHIRPATGEKRRCQSCKGTVEIKLRGCAVHEKCTEITPIDGIQWCKTCPDHPEAAPMGQVFPV